MSNFHSDLINDDIHSIGFIQNTDPGSIGLGKIWIDTTLGTGQWIIKIRNTTNTAWEVVSSNISPHFKYSYYTLSTDQLTNLSVDNHIEWDTVEGSLNGLEIGSGQANGIVDLPIGKYKITILPCGLFSANGAAVFAIYNRTGSLQLGKEGMSASIFYDYIVSNNNGIMTYVVNVISPISIDIRLTQAINLNGIDSDYSYMTIEEYAGI